MDIGSGHGYPASALSNFAPHPFLMDEVRIASMEGFLQSLKFDKPDMQEYVCTLFGRAAKFKGKHKEWWKSGKLYWRGQEIDRFGVEYQNLLDRAYDAMAAQSDSFRRALLASGNSTLTHNIGKNDERRTILTVAEFVRRLNRIRAKLFEETR